MAKNIIDTINWILDFFILIPSLIIIIVISSYYFYNIYKSIILIKELEFKYKSKFIYVKDINNERLGYKMLSYFYKNYVISINDNNSLRNILQKNPNNKLLIIIKSTGGYIYSSDSMLNLLNTHKPKKNVYIPEYAMSAATLLSFACDSIYLNKYAVMGPTDPQISVYDNMTSFNVVSKLVNNKSIDKINDKVLISYYENKMLYDDNIKYVKKYINKHKKKYVSENELDYLIEKFSYGEIPHHTELMINDLEKVININNTIPLDIIKVYNLINYIYNIS